MQTFDRYVLSQLVVVFGFFALVLVGIYWLNRAVTLFDRIVGDGHSARVFLEFTLLSLPATVALVLPMAGFAAAVYVTNRLIGDSEFTVMQATGFSPWRLARPVAVFGLIVMTMMAVLTHGLLPTALKELRERDDALASAVGAQILREGVFVHPTGGVTLYTRSIAADGTLSDVLLADRREAGRETVYTAETAYLVRTDDGPRLLMVSGLAQTFEPDSRRLSTTRFKDLSYDVSLLVSPGGTTGARVAFMSTWHLLGRTEDAAQTAQATRAQVLEEANMRFYQPLLGLVAVLIGFAALNGGGFSRFGVGRRIVGAIFLLVVVKLVESLVTDPVGDDARLWPLIYLPAVIGMAIAIALLWLAARPRSRPREAAA